MNKRVKPDELALDAPTATEKRNMLTAAVKDFDQKYPPGPAEGTAVESVDDFLKKEAVAEATERMFKTIEAKTGIDMRPQPPEPPDPFDWNTDESVALIEQPRTAIYFNKREQLVIRQEAGMCDEDDAYVFIAPSNVQTFLDRLCDAVGIPSAGKR